MPDIEPVDRLALREGFERNRAAFHELLNRATPADLKGPTDGTKWTNEQLLFHMLFGYLLVRALLPVMRIVSRLPRPAGRGFARALDATSRPTR